MHRLRVMDNHPTATYLATTLTVINVVAGAVVTIVNPDALSFDEYVTVLAINTLGLGLLAIGRGINEYGKQEAGSRALAIAYERRERPHDPDVKMPPPPPSELAALDQEDNFTDDPTRWRAP